MREDDRQRATEFVKELYAAGAIDTDRLDASVAELLAARSEIELAGLGTGLRGLGAPRRPSGSCSACCTCSRFPAWTSPARADTGTGTGTGSRDQFAGPPAPEGLVIHR